MLTFYTLWDFFPLNKIKITKDLKSPWITKGIKKIKKQAGTFRNKKNNKMKKEYQDYKKIF